MRPSGVTVWPPAHHIDKGFDEPRAALRQQTETVMIDRREGAPRTCAPGAGPTRRETNLRGRP